MKKLLVLFGVLALVSINAKESWQCDSEGKFVCAQNNTCCRSRINSSGYECFPTINGVCCSNGINCCPFGTICDLTAMTCRPKTLTFLSSPDLITTEPITVSSNPINENPLIPAGEFFEGFFQGFDFFAKITENNTCLTNEEFGKFVNDMVSKLKEIKFDETLPKFLEGLLKDFMDQKQLIDGEVQQCKVLKESADAVFDKLAKKATQNDFINKVSTHAIMNIGKVKENWEKIISLAQSKDSKNLGFAVGEFVKFVFFWDVWN